MKFAHEVGQAGDILVCMLSCLHGSMRAFCGPDLQALRCMRQPNTGQRLADASIRSPDRVDGHISRVVTSGGAEESYLKRATSKQRPRACDYRRLPMTQHIPASAAPVQLLDVVLGQL